MNIQSQIPRLHQAYCQATGFQLRLDMAREREWMEWVQRGFTEQDLRDLVKHLEGEIRAERRQPGCLKFRNLIVNLDYFEEDLAELRARRRITKPNEPRASVLRSTGRPSATPPQPARSASNIAAGLQAFNDFKKMKENL